MQVLEAKVTQARWDGPTAGMRRSAPAGRSAVPPRRWHGPGTVGLTVELAGLKSERSQTMTDTIDDVAADPVEVPAVPAIDEQGVAEQLVAQARRRASSWLALTGCFRS